MSSSRYRTDRRSPIEPLDRRRCPIRARTTARAAALTAPLIALALALCSPLPATGQEEEAGAEPDSAVRGDHPHRGGFWLSGGIGPGFDEDLDAGSAVSIRLGGTPGSHVLLGGEILGLALEDGGSTITRSNLMATALVYPSARGGFFLKGGLGLASIETEVELVGGREVSVSDETLGASLGLGHDVRLGDGNLYLAPTLDALLQIPDAEISATDASFLLTVGIGWR